MRADWKFIRVFVSSTFRDMQSERDHLVRFVFPKLREELLLRHIHLVDVDLRWGVTGDQDVSEVCSEIIDECRPRFLCILGGRYGSVPPGETRSITADEVYYGVLNRKLDDRGSSFFYFRDDAATADMVETTPGEFREPPGSERRIRLVELKADILAAGFHPFTYPAQWDNESCRLTGLKQFGDRVYKDLLATIDAEFGEVPPKPDDDFAEENAAIAAFVEERTEQFVIGSREVVLSELLAHAASTGGNGYVCVTGAPGSGKSALLAHLGQHPSFRDQSSTLIIRHFIGVTAGSTDVYRTLRRLCHELKVGCPEITAEVPDDRETLRAAFPDFLRQACARRRVLVIVDAIQELDQASYPGGLDWLPEELPTNATVFLSTLDCPAMVELRRRAHRFREIELKPLTAEDARTIIEQFEKRYHKSFEPEQRAALLAKTDVGTPLYLRAALEELRTLGSFEELTSRIRELPPTTQELFAWILERLQHDEAFRAADGRPVGRALVSSFGALLGASRYGLSGREISDLLDAGDPQGNVAALLQLVRPYLMHRGKLLDFYHAQFRAAVKVAWLRTEVQNRGAHKRLAQYFERKMLSSRTVACVPWHFYHAGDWERLRDCLSNLASGYFEAFFNDGLGRQELLMYWKALASRYDIVSTYEQALTAYQQEVPPEWDLTDLTLEVGEFLAVAGPWDAAQQILSKAFHASHATDNTPQRVDILQKFASLLWKKGSLAEAENLFRQALALSELLLGADDPGSAAILTCLGEVLREKGDLENARNIQSRALAIFEQKLGSGDPNTVASMMHLGFACSEMGDLDAAERYLERALELSERIFGKERGSASHILNGLAMVSKARKDLHRALDFCQRALLARERDIVPTHPDLVPVLFNLGSILFDLGNYAAAEPVLKRAREIREASFHEGDQTTAKLLLLLGLTLGYQHKYSASIEVLYASLHLKEALLGRDHPETVLVRQLIDAIEVLTHQSSNAHPARTENSVDR